MKKNLLSLLLLVTAAFYSQASDKLRIACIGSSNTYGSGAFDPSRNSYPSQLSMYLAGKAEVCNFGMDSATVLTKGGRPYVESIEYKKALAFEPDIVIMEFGLADCTPANEPFLADFKKDYTALIGQFKSLPSAPRIILLSTTPVFDTPETTPAPLPVEALMEEIAWETGSELLNIYMLFDGKYFLHLMEDKRRISSTGAYLVASRIHEHIENKRADFDITRSLKTHTRKKDHFHGFPLHYHADLAIVSPRYPLRSKSWMLSVKPMPEEPQVEIALLERGFHVVYCKADEMDLVYKVMRKAGLSRQVVVAAGQWQTAALKWVEENAGNVDCLYTDSIVSINNNAVKTISLGRPDGKAPYAVVNPRQIVNFITGATGNRVIETTIPVPGNEYRWKSVAWTEHSNWFDVAGEIDEILQARKVDVLLLGNSLVQGFGGTRQRITRKPGLEPLTNALGDLTWESAGVNSDRVQHLLWRLRNGNYAAAEPAYVVIAIGVNNMGNDGDLPEEIVEGIMAVVKEVRMQMPRAQVILFGMLPAQLDPTGDIRQRIDAAHTILARTGMPRQVTYINPTPWFVNEDGTLKTELYGSDLLHLSVNGYEAWSRLIAETIHNLSN